MRSTRFLGYYFFVILDLANHNWSRRYLQAQGLLRAPSIITLLVAPMNIALNYLLVWGPEPIRLG